MKDRHGNSVELGDIVRVVEICQAFLDILPEDEKPHIMGMLNNEYPIDDFPEDGKASVSIWWNIEDGVTGYGGLYMLPQEFELVRKAQSKDAVIAEILGAFAAVEFPGDWCLIDSHEGDEPHRVAAEFSGKDDWRVLDTTFIDQAPGGLASALSFFSDEAFHFYLPAYLLADLDGNLESANPLFHLTFGLDEASRHEKINPRRYGERTWFDHARYKFSMFNAHECRAILCYLNFKRSDVNVFDREKEHIDQAIASYWGARAL